MTEYDPAEFRKALGRLYDSIVRLNDLADKQLAITQSHEKRLDHIEVVQQWLAEAERKREIEGGKL